MVTFKDGKIDMDCLEIKDIIDINVLQKFLDNFALGMNCAAVSVDRNGEEITRPSYYREFCQNYIHNCMRGDERCARCHNNMGEEAVKLGKPYVGYCHTGLIDFAAPIIIEGVHMGTVLGGQILDKEPEEANIRKVASELGIDQEELWKAAEKIDIVKHENIVAAAEVLHVVVERLAQDGYNRIETGELSTNLAENFIQISATIEMLAESAQEISGAQQNLSQEIGEIDRVTKEISQVLIAISKMADKTKLIGINASIEAARLGTDGRGFTVVANEIQNLSLNSKSTAKQIDTLNAQIDEKIESTIANATKTLGVTEDQSAAMEELSATVQNSVELAEKLKKLIECD